MFEGRHLTKRYPRITALNAVSFHIARGEILGYLGPNGSGKSTTIKIITGLIDPSDGQVFLIGQRVDEDPPRFVARLGYVPEEPYLYTHLTAPEYLRSGRTAPRDCPAAPLDSAIESAVGCSISKHAAHGLMTVVFERHASAGARGGGAAARSGAARFSTSPSRVSTSTPACCCARSSTRWPSAAKMIRSARTTCSARGNAVCARGHSPQGASRGGGHAAGARVGAQIAIPREAFALVTEQEDYRARVIDLSMLVYPAKAGHHQ